ncbi:hypothetical protein M1307_04005 [Patescibacteria group bacterium]|nr:hypothetical protein [Patescibacteria group bacterium]
MNKLFFAIILFSAIVVWHFPVIKNYLTPSSIDSLPDLSDIDFDKHNLKNNPKLAAFYQWTKEDPLFTSPDFDSESFAKTIDALEQEEKALLSAIASPDPLFPISFLKRVSETNKIYKEFLASPSIDSGKNLISSYLVLRNSYSQNLENLEKVLENRKLFSLKPNFIGLGTTTTLQVTKEDLEKLRQNAKKLEEEIKNRETCLVSGKQCQRPASSFSRKPSAEEEITFSQNDFLPKEILLPKIDRDVSLFGPYVVSTDCFGWSEDLTKKTYPFYLTGEQVEKRDLASQISFPSQTSKLATTNYYRRLRETSPADKPFLDEGYAWVSQNETNPYMCPDNSYLTTLSSLDKFYRTYRNSPLFITLDNLPKEVETVLKEGADFEEKFFKSRVPSNGSAENLSNYYAYTYREIGELR